MLPLLIVALAGGGAALGLAIALAVEVKKLAGRVRALEYSKELAEKDVNRLDDVTDLHRDAIDDLFEMVGHHIAKHHEVPRYDLDDVLDQVVEVPE